MSEWLQCEFSDDDIKVVELPSRGASKGSKSVANKKRKVLSNRRYESQYKTDDLWLNKYKPQSISQVAGNKAKIAQLHEWMKQATAHRSADNILLITGPSGCGKTAAVEAIAAELNISIKQWNSQTVDFISIEQRGDNSVDYVSQMSLFDSFLLRATKYRALPMSVDDVGMKQLVLVEDIPAVYIKSPPEWHNKLKMYHKTSHSLLVIIFNTSGTVTERAMFPESLRNQLNIKHFAFNPVPKTDIKRLLTTISDTELHLNISKDFITSLSESCDGDIRTAVNTLQFTCSAPLAPRHDTKSRSVRVGSTRGKRKSKASNSTTKTSLLDTEEDAETRYKDTTLVIFRALGKVLHCKRHDNQLECESLLPAHLRHHVRREMAFNPEQVFEQAQVSADYYTLCLHQNYPQFLSNIENVQRVSDYLSHSDCLSQQFTERQVTGRAPVSVSIAARGLMHANTVMSSTKHGWLPLHKPYWFTANKQIRENQVNMKWQNNTTYSTSSVSQDILPALHLMKVKTTLTELMAPIVLSKRQYSTYNQDRMDDKYGRDDINLDISIELETPAGNTSKEADEKEFVDDPEEYRIEAVD